MSQNVDALRSGYEAFGRGDLPAVMELWHDDIEWEGPNHPGLPGAGTHRGKDAVQNEVLGTIPQHWDEFRLTPDEFVDGGDTVVVLGHIEAKAKATGSDVKVPVVHVWRMRDGKVARAQTLSDTAVLVEALGRS